MSADISITTGQNVPKVLRSSVTPGLPYTEYRKYLRYDFLFSCGYCSMSEAEAQAIRFTIDHFEPRGTSSINPDEYENLMYSCDECNSRKSNIYPSEKAQADGYGYFRVDRDIFDDHFAIIGIRLNDLSKVGFFTINALDLNRLSLRRIRELRKRLEDCDVLVAQGLLGLRRAHIDRLPRELRGRVLASINQANGVALEMAAAIDDVLQQNARSPLLDEDPEAAERAKMRAAAMKDLRALHPGQWRVPRQKSKNIQGST